MLSFADPLRHAERCYRDRTAIVDGATCLTFGDLAGRLRRVRTMVEGLTDPGDRVALLAANSHRWLEVFYGVPIAQRVVMPMNWRLADAELSYQLGDSEARVLITDRPRASLGELAVLVDEVIEFDGDYDSRLTSAEPAPVFKGEAAPDPAALAALFYTGGTTGAAKGVMTTHANKIADTFHLSTSVQLRPTDRWLVMAPMFHASGTFQSLLCSWFGVPQILLPGFDAATVLDVIDSQGATITFGVPTMMLALAVEQERRTAVDPRKASAGVGSLRMFGYGAAPASSSLLRRFHAAFPHAELVSMYGATELSPMATALNNVERFIDDDIRARTAGRALIGVDLRIVDDNGSECPIGDVGEVVVRGPNVMVGYWKKPDATASTIRDGWYHSGDLGHLDSEGLLYLVDRKKDMIITGGENVYSTEVEDVLARHPAVAECAVFAIPDDRWGEAVAAAVVLREGMAATADELRDFCRAGLAGYKVPRLIELQRELPRSGAGKILKRELRQPHWADQDRGIH